MESYHRINGMSPPAASERRLLAGHALGLAMVQSSGRRIDLGAAGRIHGEELGIHGELMAEKPGESMMIW